MAQTVLDVARSAAGVLAERANIENARLEAELLLAHVLGLRRIDLYLQFDRPLEETELEAYRSAVRRRLRREPLQYIVGETGFRNLVLKVDRRALIPRPETEVLVGEVLEWAARSGAKRALDIGTGSGAIALSLAQESQLDQVTATDVSADALCLARENAERLGLTGRVDFRLGESWTALAPDERFDIIVSNPPYVAEADRASLAPEVRDWEPATALFAENHGLAVIEEIVTGAAPHLAPGGLLALEVGLEQASRVAGMAAECGHYKPARIVLDLTGRERVVLAERS